MTDYPIHLVAVYDQIGGVVRVARNSRIDVLDPATGLVAAGLKVGGVSVSFVTTDASGQADFTVTIPTVDVVSPHGLIERISSHVAVEAAVGAGVSSDAAVAAVIANPASASRVAGDAVYSPLTVGGKTASRKGDVVVSVLDYGAVGNGVADDTTAINSAITAGAGRTVFLPAGTYMVNAIANVGHMSHAVGLRLTAAGTRLLLDRGATIKVIANSATRYSAVEITAADCSVEGGTIQGDVGTHTGSTGEWGYGIDINTGADRCTVRGTRVTKCWGDGIVIGDGSTFSGAAEPVDVRIIDCTCEDNRRNNISIIAATRPQVIGGSYVNAGLTAYTAPGAGIAVEPNPGGSQTVTDCVINGVTATGNKGRGVYIHGQGNTCTVTVVGARASGNLADGFAADSSTTRARFQGCTASGNTGVGFSLPSTLGPVELMACVSESNTTIGYSIASTGAVLTSCVARDNQRDGYYVDVAAVTPQLIACTSVGNCTAGNASWIREFEVFAVNAVLQGCVAEVGTNTNKATIGFAVRSGATTGRLIGCTTRGTFSTAAYQGQTDTLTLPVPGVAKQTGTPAAATDAATTQALVNDLRTKLIALGHIA